MPGIAVKPVKIYISAKSEIAHKPFNFQTIVKI